MPTDTETESTVTCRACLNHHAPSAMSILTGFCLGCFERHFVLCADCGAHLRRPNVAVRGFSPSDYATARMVDGDPCCSSCRYLRGDNRYWRPKPLNASVVSYDGIGSRRKFGVEIETSHCPRRESLQDCSHFGCKSDPTVDGMEFDSPILYGDEGLDHIRELIDYGAERGWEVDYHCGCHTHYDMRDETDESLYRIFYAYRLVGPVWEKCVTPDRLTAGYAGPMNVSARTIRRNYEGDVEFSQFCHHRQRYDYINVCAYNDHKTFEVRLLEGQLDPTEICNWIKLHCRFIDKAKELTFPRLQTLFANKTGQERFDALATLIDDRELMSWLARRIERESGCIFTLPRMEAAEPAQPGHQCPF